MKAKEKANELWTTYRFALSIKNAPFVEQKDLIAKQCALIAVGEIIDLADRVSDIQGAYLRGTENNNYTPAIKEYEFWQDVKQELEQL